MAAIGSWGPALAMLAAFALAVGGVRMLLRGGERLKPVLMLVMAAVLVGNVLVATL